ncbi:MAG: protein kinase domain-containing protein [Planctomycetales bacterium]
MQPEAPVSPAPPPASKFVPGTLLLERYRIVSLLGRGGMGEVYRADDLRLDQPVALKFLMPTAGGEAVAIARISQEVKLARWVTHANVCRVHDLGQAEGLQFLSMEFVDGEDLSTLLHRAGGFPRARALDLARQMSAGLMAAHAKSVIHRDLKPANLLLDRQGRLVITDFGLAACSEQLSAQRTAVGTLPYMAPEQLFGQRATERSDLYALGLVLHELFTGKRVFRAETYEELLKVRRTVKDAASRIDPALPDDVRQIVLQCLAFDSQARPVSAADVFRALCALPPPLAVGGTEVFSGTMTLLLADVPTGGVGCDGGAVSSTVVTPLTSARVRDAVASTGGILCQTDERSLCAAFPTAQLALASAVRLQTLLKSEVPGESPMWPLRVMLHTGAADIKRGELTGPTVARTRQILEIGYAGQILVSATTQELVCDELPAGVTLRDLGPHRLPDLDRPQRLYQVVAESLPDTFPPPRSLSTIPNNLPQQVTSFVGREQVLARLKRSLSSSRLVTLLGTGGAGKSRLSVQAGADLLGGYPDGVWFVELAPLTDESLVPQTVAAVIGIREEGTRPIVQTLHERLKSQQMLIILDNCEHLVPACAALAEGLLRKCPQVRILASSRERLAIGGELEFRVPTLSLPAKADGVSAEQALEFEAVSLFVQRAQAVSPSFQITHQNTRVIIDICRHLDGIPLAIELAAPRVRALALEDLRSRLDDCLRVLSGGLRTAQRRQQTIRALIDWSYDLLAEPERKLLARLGVFAGGWTMEAAEKICAGEGIEVFEVLDLLTSLVDKSLVMADTESRHARYRLLETVRQYAHDKLHDFGQADHFRKRHQEHYLAFVQNAHQRLNSAEGGLWADRFEIDHDNIRAAIDFAVGVPERAEAALRLVNEMSAFWIPRGHFREFDQRMTAALAATEHLGRTEERALALIGAGNARLACGDCENACRRYEESLTIRRELGDQSKTWHSLFNYGNALNLVGDLAAARACLEEALALSVNYPNTYAGTRCNLGETLALAGEAASAEAMLREALEGFRKSGNSAAVAEISNFLGRIDQSRGDLAAARAHYREAELLLRINRFVGFGFFAGPYCFALLALAAQQWDRAARLYGAHDGIRDRQGTPLPPVLRNEYDQALRQLHQALGDEAFRRYYEGGRTMTEEQATAYALEEWDPDIASSR